MSLPTYRPAPIVRLVLLTLLLWAVVACANDKAQPAGTKLGATQQAVWSNGDFESDGIGTSPPTGWTVNTYLNPGITDTRPGVQTLASLNLGAGGAAASSVVGGAPETQADPDIGAGGTFRYPKYGQRAAIINRSASVTGTGRNTNSLKQTMTVSLGDVDPTDNKVHVRFAIAPVLENPGHSYTSQPYYYVRLQNLTTGAPVYQDFNASGQPGVPWKDFTDTSGQAAQYTDWQLVDVSPGNAALAVGDQVELTVVAAGCSAGGHWGRVYVDAVGSGIPGLYAWGSGPQLVNAGADITYTLNYKNGGTTTTTGSKLDFVTPPSTVFKSVSLGASCSAPTVGTTGTVSCPLGTLANGSTGSFTVTVTVPSGTANGTLITNGNYSIYASGVSALVGPKVQTTVTSGAQYANVGITKTDGLAAAAWGQAITYTIVASNAGPLAAPTVTVADTMPAQLTGVTWTCATAGGASCAASGSGNINDATVSLPVGSTATYTVNANIVAGTGSGKVINTVTATVGGGRTDPDTTDNTALDSDNLGTLRTLSLTKAGTASAGSVTSVPASIACGTGCSSASGDFLDGSQVVLTAAPIAGATFNGWGGACSGTATSCTVTMAGAQSVSASFTGAPSAFAIAGGGTQSTATGAAFGSPLSILVTDSGGNGVPGVAVSFAAPGAGASATLSGSTATTNASGIASVTATANATAGAYAVTATVSGIAGTQSFALTNVGVPASIAVSAGSGQTTSVTTAFAASLRAIVRDASNQPVSGATVTFAPPGAGPGATLSSTTATTDASGIASVTATANGIAGSFAVAASVTGVATPTSFALTNAAGAAASVAAQSGSGQSATVATAFGAQLVARVADAQGNPVSGVNVAFAAPGAGASATLGAASATSDASGLAAVNATANGVAGTFAVTATAAGVATPVAFTETNVAGAAASIAVASGSPQSAVVGTAFGAQLVVAVVDAFGNPVAGVAVGFGVPATGASASLSNAAPTTDDAGIAGTSATAGFVSGAYPVAATVAGIAAPAVFALDNTPSAPASVTVSAGGAQSATVGSAFGTPLAVVVRDAYGNAVPGVSVSFTAPGGGASATLSSASATSNAAGTASVTASANTLAGSYAVTAMVAGLPGVTFSLGNTPGAPTGIAVLSGSGQSTTVTSAFSSPLVAHVTDAHGNAVSGVAVTFAAPGAGPSATLGASAVATDASGHASTTATASSLAGAFSVSATAAGVGSSATFALTSTAGAVASIAVASGDAQSQRVNAAFPAPLVVVVQDAHGNPVPGTTVTFAPPGAGATAALSGGGAASTDVGGRASVVATASPVAGAYSVVASATGAAAPATFALTNTPGAPATIDVAAGGTQSTTVAQTFASPLRVIVHDSVGNVVPGASVTYAARVPSSAPAASLSAQVAVTDAAGQTEVGAVANTVAGAYDVSASLGSGPTATFSLRNLPGAPASMVASAASSPQAATVLQPYANALQVTVLDAFGNVVPGAAVTFAAPGAGPTAALDTASVLSDAQGRAIVHATASSLAGAFIAQATVTGVAAATVFSLTNLAGAPAAISVSLGDAQSAVVGTPFAQALEVSVQDADGNAVPNAAVTFTPPTTGPTAALAATVITTDASGHASTSASAGTVTGRYDVTATVSGGAAPAVFALTNTPGAPAAIVASSASTPQSARVTTRYVQPLVATVTDAYGNAVPSAAVAYAAPAGGATGTLDASSATTDAQGRATTGITASSTAGAFEVTATVTGVAMTARFALANLFGPASTLAVSGGSPQHAVVGTSFSAPLVAQVHDAYGNPVADATVVFAAPTSAATAALTTPTAKTDASGKARTQVTAGTSTGSYDVVATMEGAATPIRFALTNEPGAAFAVIAEDTATPQSAEVGHAFARMLQVTVRDAFGNRVPGESVHFAAPDAGATATLSAADTATDGEGASRVLAIANERVGSYDVTASVHGLTTPAAFSLTNTATAPATISLESGGAQHTMATKPYGAPLVFRALDALGNPVQGAQVTLTFPAQGPSARPSASSALTDARGAVAFALKANDVVGSFRMTARVEAARAPATALLAVDAIPTQVQAKALATSVSVDQPVTVEAVVTGAALVPTGVVTVTTMDGTSLGSAPLAEGKASAKITLRALGSQEIRVSYAASGPFAASQSAPMGITAAADSGSLSGGRGCSIGSTRGGGSSGGATFALFGVLAIVVRWAARARARAKRTGILAGLIAAGWTVREEGSAAAQSTTGVAIDRFHAAAADSEWFASDSVGFRGPVTPAVALVGDYARMPLVAYDANGEKRAEIVRNALVLHAGLSLTLFDRLRLSGTLPLAPFQDGESGTFNGVRLDAPKGGISDLTLGADVRMVGKADGALRVSLGAKLALPTGSRRNYLGDGVVSIEPRAMAAGSVGIFEYAAQAGVVLRGDTDVGGVGFGHELRLTAAAGLRLVDRKLLLGPELIAAVPLQSGGGNGSAAEGHLGAHYTLPAGFKVGGGVGIGFVNAVGTPDQRFLLSIAWSPEGAPKREESAKAAPEAPMVPAPTAPLLVAGTTDEGVTDGAGSRVAPAPESLAAEPPAKVAVTAAQPPAPDFPGAGEVFAERVHFATNHADVAGSEIPSLERVAQALKAHPRARVRVEGHTDDVGPKGYNVALSQARARAVVGWLARHGVAASRVELTGFGFAKPAEEGTTDGARAQNRRVEFRVFEK